MRLLGRLEALLWVSGTILLGYCVYVGAQKAASRRNADRVVAAARSSQGGTLRAAGVVTDDRARSKDGGVIGRIDIPALTLSAPITAGFDAESLRRGVGHVRGTALPGGLGTVGLVGHRDSFFRPLRTIAAGMEIRLTDRSGTYRYRVDRTEVVDPGTIEVLDVTSTPELTLVTCFPFDYAGPAPQRFIVHAHLLSVVPDQDGSL